MMVKSPICSDPTPIFLSRNQPLFHTNVHGQGSKRLNSDNNADFFVISQERAAKWNLENRNAI